MESFKTIKEITFIQTCFFREKCPPKKKSKLGRKGESTAPLSSFLDGFSHKSPLRLKDPFHGLEQVQKRGENHETPASLASILLGGKRK